MHINTIGITIIIDMYKERGSRRIDGPAEPDTGALHPEYKQQSTDCTKPFLQYKHALLLSCLAVGITAALYFLNLYIFLTASTRQSGSWSILWNLFALLFGVCTVVGFHFFGNRWNRWTGFLFNTVYFIIHLILLLTISLSLSNTGETISASFTLNPQWMVSFYGVLYGIFFVMYYFRRKPEKKNASEEEVEDMLFYSMLPFPLNVLTMKIMGRPLPKAVFEFQIWVLAMMGVSFIVILGIILMVALLT